MRKRTQEQREQLAEVNRRKLLAAESAALLLLLRRRNKVVTAGLAAGATAATIASGIQAAWRPAVAQARTFSRGLGISRLRAELESLGVDRGLARTAAEEAVRDALRARVIALSYAETWRRAAESKGAGQASEVTLGSLTRIAVTESAEAYNAGRLRSLPRHLSVMRIWDAQLDKRTCPVCESADGTIVAASESFPIGEPGAVHPNCRCTWQLITLQESQ